MSDVLKGLEMCGKHIYKITRWNNGKGGASKIPLNVIDNLVLGLLCVKINNCHPLLPSGFKDVKPHDVWIPRDAYRAMQDVNRFVSAHTVAGLLANTMMDTIIDMRRFGMVDCYQYKRFIERLDAAPPQSFKDYIQICIEYEKEMKQ